MKIVDYVIIDKPRTAYYQELVDDVNKLIGEGFLRYGSLVVCGENILQALIKYGD